MLLHDVLDAVEIADQIIEVRPGAASVEVRSIEHDSRSVQPGDLFCCIPGAHADGHEYAVAAVAAGAVACVVERPVPVDVPQVRVTSVRRVLGPMCARFYGEPSGAMRVLGVTGTNGKTTTAFLLESIARTAGDRTGVIGTIGARLGDDELALRHTTPEATDLQALLARMRDAGVQTVSMEVSSHALDQHRVDGTHFAAACFTNLSHDHLDYHGSLDAYFEAKARLFTSAFTERAAIGVDDEHGRRLEKLAREAGLDVCTYALDGPADVTARDVDLTPTGSTFVAVACGREIAVHLSLLGRFNVQNALAAAATATVGGFDAAAIGGGLSQLVVVPGRMEPVDAGQPFVVLVDYAHTPDALRVVLDAARALVAGSGRAGRLLVVFGCGGDRDRAKRPVMGNVATRLADVAILTNDNPRSEDPGAIAAEVLTGVEEGSEPIVELDRRAAIRAAVRAAHPGDVVVIAGKGHETGQTAGGITTLFDDRVVARAELEARA